MFIIIYKKVKVIRNIFKLITLPQNYVCMFIHMFTLPSL